MFTFADSCLLWLVLSFNIVQLIISDIFYLYAKYINQKYCFVAVEKIRLNLFYWFNFFFFFLRKSERQKSWLRRITLPIWRSHDFNLDFHMLILLILEIHGKEILLTWKLEISKTCLVGLTRTTPTPLQNSTYW